MSERIELINVEADNPPSTTGEAHLPREPGPGPSPIALVTTLTLTGVLAGLLIVLVYQATLPGILAYRERQVELAVKEVLDAPARVEKRFFYRNTLMASLPADGPTGTAAQRVDKVFLGYHANGTLKGVALTHAEPGFQDLVQVIFGYSPARQQVLGMKVLGHKETPGLGDKIVLDRAFVEQFAPVSVPIIAVKPGRGDGSPQTVDTITGATISSKAVIRIINHAIERWNPVLARSDLSRSAPSGPAQPSQEETRP